MQLTKVCRDCGTEHQITVSAEAMRDWKNGMLIQDAMPNLTPDLRELFISGICGTCFDKIFSDDVRHDCESGDICTCPACTSQDV